MPIIRFKHVLIHVKIVKFVITCFDRKFMLKVVNKDFYKKAYHSYEITFIFALKQSFCEVEILKGKFILKYAMYLLQSDTSPSVVTIKPRWVQPIRPT